MLPLGAAGSAIRGLILGCIARSPRQGPHCALEAPSRTSGDRLSPAPHFLGVTRTWRWPGEGGGCRRANGLAALGAGSVGDRRRLHAIGHAQLAQDVGHVDARGLDADVQGVGDLPVGPAGGDQGEHLLLPGREPEAGRVDRSPPRSRARSGSGWRPPRCRSPGGRHPLWRPGGGPPAGARWPRRGRRCWRAARRPAGAGRRPGPGLRVASAAATAARQRSGSSRPRARAASASAIAAVACRVGAARPAVQLALCVVEGVDAGDQLLDSPRGARIGGPGFAPVGLGPQALGTDEDREVIPRKREGGPVGHAGPQPVEGRVRASSQRPSAAANGTPTMAVCARRGRASRRGSTRRTTPEPGELPRRRHTSTRR